MPFSPTQQHPLSDMLTLLTLVEGWYDATEFNDPMQCSLPRSLS